MREVKMLKPEQRLSMAEDDARYWYRQAQVYRGEIERLKVENVDLRLMQYVKESDTPLNDLAAEIHKNAVEKGWYAPAPTFGEQIALMHSELSEALEEWRSGREKVWLLGNENPQGWAVELVDCFLRILGHLHHHEVDIDAVSRHKMAYNKTRSYRHGGKLL